MSRTIRGGRAGTNADGALSIHRSFVVRFHPGVDAKSKRASGRIEHILSAEAADFRSLEELLVFVCRFTDPETVPGKAIPGR